MSRLGNVGGRLYRGEVSIDFVGRRKMFYLISGLILVISIVALLVRGLSYSVDFKGGSTFQFSAPAASSAKVAATVVAAGGGPNPTVEVIHPPGKPPLWYVQTIQLKSGQGSSFGQGNRVQDAIAKEFGIPAAQVSRSFVGPTWGGQISKKALEALIAFLIVIVIYLSIAFEARMATAALVALIHDIVITVGVYALTGFQVSPATVIGLLTILGYSLYDTVVVFDKVRENTAGLLGTRKSTYSYAANLALNQTLVRSINTSLTALLPVAAILVVGVGLLGNGELKDLSLVLFIGMLSGTYSSICIATPVLADLKEREPQYKQLAKQVALRAAGGRSKLRKTRATAGAPSSRASRTGGTNTLPASDEAAPDELGFDGAVDEAPDDATPGEMLRNGTAVSDADDPGTDGEIDGPVTAGRPAGGQARPAGSRPAQGPRQQPRRSGAAKRRPAGKKKRR
jgi:preprotein translocase subunit SecF